MAKSKVKSKARALTEIEAQLRNIVMAMETTVRHEVECCVCEDRQFEDDLAELDYAKRLHAKGWRWEKSEKWGVLGAMCPVCVGTPDAERGED